MLGGMLPLPGLARACQDRLNANPERAPVHLWSEVVACCPTRLPTEKELVEVPEEPEAGTQEAAAAAAASRGGAAAASAAGGGGFGSAKVAALLERLRQDAAATAAGAAAGAGGGAVKSVVFSQFTSYLDLVEVRMRWPP